MAKAFQEIPQPASTAIFESAQRLLKKDGRHWGAGVSQGPPWCTPALPNKSVNWLPYFDGCFQAKVNSLRKSVPLSSTCEDRKVGRTRSATCKTHTNEASKALCPHLSVRLRRSHKIVCGLFHTCPCARSAPTHSNLKSFFKHFFEKCQLWQSV